jgi:hypothetical protein
MFRVLDQVDYWRFKCLHNNYKIIKTKWKLLIRNYLQQMKKHQVNLGLGLSS